MEVRFTMDEVLQIGDLPRKLPRTLSLLLIDAALDHYYDGRGGGSAEVNLFVDDNGEVVVEII